MKRLVERGAPVDVIDQTGMRPLDYAIRHNQAEVVAVLADAGVSFEEIDGKNDDLTPAMAHAAVHGHTAMIALFMKEGMDPSCADVSGWTPLHFAFEESLIFR